MIDSRRLEDLNPIMRVLVTAFLKKAEEQGIPVVITSTYRDAECQNKYFNAKPPVTTVRGNYSYHQWRVAADIVPRDEKGNPTWSPKDPGVWNRLGEIGKSVGLEWGGSWSGFVDKPHYQCTFGFTCNDFIKGVPVPTQVKKGCGDKIFVAMLQNVLNKTGAKLVVDGIFGNGTEAAIKNFQKTQGLPETGVVDAITLDRLH